MARKGEIKFIIEVDDKGSPQIRAVKGEVEGLSQKVSKSGGIFKSVRAHWMAYTAALAAGIYTIARVGKAFVSAAGEAEMFRTQLYGVSDSFEEANQAYEKMLEFAARTPHMTQDVVAAFIQLRSVGLDPNIKSIKTLGDVAFLFNRNIRDVSSALISFEVEVLRRLGIEIDRTGKKVKIMSGNMIIETEKSADAIRAGLLYVWETRFGGAMEKAESTWKGVAALFKSAVWEMQKSLGEMILPGLKLVVQLLTNVIFRIRDWAANNRIAVQDIIKNGLMKIINGLEYLSWAIQAVSETWLGWKELIIGLRTLIAKLFETAIKWIRNFIEKINFRGIFDKWIADMDRVGKNWELVANNQMKKLDEVINSHENLREIYRKIRAGIEQVGIEAEKQWPKLTALATASTAAGTLAGTGAGAPGGPGGLPAAAEEAESNYIILDSINALHSAKMTAWEEELVMMMQINAARDQAGMAWQQLMEAEDLYIGLRSAVKGAFQSTILGYESMGEAIRKATAQVLLFCFGQLS